MQASIRVLTGLLPYVLRGGTNIQRREGKEIGKKLVPDVIFWYQFSATRSFQ